VEIVHCGPPVFIVVHGGCHAVRHAENAPARRLDFLLAVGAGIQWCLFRALIVRHAYGCHLTASYVATGLAYRPRAPRQRLLR
jgi:hypothetical protein